MSEYYTCFEQEADKDGYTHIVTGMRGTAIVCQTIHKGENSALMECDAWESRGFVKRHLESFLIPKRKVNPP